MRLELDVGNTRIKWRVCDHRGVFDQGMDLYSALEAKPSWQGLIQQVWVSSVLSEQSTRILETFPQAKFANTQISQMGLINSYEDVNRMGVDRWLAMLAAWNKSSGIGHIVIDAGTAITLDIIDEFGRHVGGYICPGLQMMKTSLLGKTDQVRAHKEWSQGRAPGNQTQLCVDHGIQDMVACWVERHRSLQPESHITLTGGDGQWLAELLSSPVSFEMDLVLDGLSLSMNDLGE